jgi:hypothetical protein
MGLGEYLLRLSIAIAYAVVFAILFLIMVMVILWYRDISKEDLESLGFLV